MLAPFLIMLREGLEAALIVGIIAGYLDRTGRAAWLPAIWVGVLLALAASLAAGAALRLMSADFPQKAQELFEALVAFVAVLVLASMVFWMRRAARSIGGELRGRVDAAFSGGTGTAVALAGMSFFAVGREGLESVFFLTAVFQQGSSAGGPLGALAGLVVAVALGYGLYAGAVRIDLGRFFRWTGVFILLVAAGLLASGLRSLHEAGLFNVLQARVYDFSSILPTSSVTGAVLSGLFGYQESAGVGEVLAYVLFLVPALVLYLRPAGRRAAPAAATS
jgi:high-affinity iron transporter